MTLLETIQYFLTETAADMDGLSWEIREETNFEDNNIEHLTECYDFNKELYDNLKQIKLMIEEKDPVKQILNDPNDELDRLIARIPGRSNGNGRAHPQSIRGITK
jgi:NAD-dependent DNA ligase